jgi:hypothetical protein
MAHAQKPHCVFRRNGRVHLNRRGASVQSTTGSRVVRINGSNAGYTMFRASVKCTGCPLHPPVSPSLPLPCVTVCHHISTGLYHILPHTVATSRTRHVSLFVLFRGMPFDTFGLQRACGWRMNECQGNIVLVCVGCGVGGHSVFTTSNLLFP